MLLWGKLWLKRVSDLSLKYSCENWHFCQGSIVLPSPTTLVKKHSSCNCGDVNGSAFQLRYWLIGSFLAVFVRCYWSGIGADMMEVYALNRKSIAPTGIIGMASCLPVSSAKRIMSCLDRKGYKYVFYQVMKILTPAFERHITYTRVWKENATISVSQAFTLTLFSLSSLYPVQRCLE